MDKEVKINFTYGTHEYLLTFYRKGIMVKWEVVNRSTDIPERIQKFYFPYPSSKD